MNTYDLSLVSFLKVIDKELHGVFGFFEEEEFGELVKKWTEFVGLHVFLGLDLLDDCLLLVHLGLRKLVFYYDPWMVWLIDFLVKLYIYLSYLLNCINITQIG